MPRKILVFFMSMVLLGGYSISVYRAQADSDTDDIPMYWLQGTLFVDDVPLTLSNPQHAEYTLVPIVRSLDPLTSWTELEEYQMGSKDQDVYELRIFDTDKTGGISIQNDPNFEMRIAIYMKGDKSTQLDVNIGTSAGEPWYVGKNVVGEFFAEADVYAYIPPGQPEDLLASATVSSDIHNINLQWTAPGSDNGIGTVSGYLARLSTSDITTPLEWDNATPLTTGWTSLLPADSTEDRTAISSSALDPNGTYYVALRAVDAAGTPGPFISAQVNMPPTATSVAIAPSDPPTAETTDNLELTYSYSDPESDPESGTLIKWYKGGALQSTYNNQNPLPWSATMKGDIWKASVQPANAKGKGLEVESNELTILNTPPVAGANGPYSSKIDSGGTTVLPITFNGAGSSDADGDPLTYSWDFGNGATVTDHPNPTYDYTYPPAPPATYIVTLTVNDGEVDSDPVDTTATVTINKKPVADVGGPYEGIAGEPLTFDGSNSDDPDDDEDISDLLFKWDFDNDGNVDYQSPARGVSSAEYTYPTPGPYTASLVVSDYLEDSASDTVNLMIYARPVAEFTWSPDPQDEGLQVTFEDQSTDADGEIIAWSWDFDASDGIQVDSIEQDPTHIYMDDGSYVVTLTVTDDTGMVGTETLAVNNALQSLQDSVEHTVIVSDLGPTAEFIWDPATQVEGTPVDFTDTSTSYPDDIASWAWDFDDGGSSTEQNPSYIFMDNGTYTVELTVTDEDGSTDNVQHEVIITDAAPTAEFTWLPAEPVEGAEVQFTDDSESPADAIDTWAWDFDDGGSSTDQNPTHTFMDNGTYTVELTVTDDDGSTDTIQHEVIVADAAPTAEFTWLPAEPVEGAEVQFTDASTSPADVIDTWAWDFDDGGSSTDQNPTHTFMDNGTYTVELTVTDDDGSTDTIQHEVIVADAAPTAEFTWAPDPQDEGSAVVFTDASTSPADAIASWAWDFDDGDTSTDQNTSHTFEDNGIYTVELTVTDDDGSTDTVQHDVTVSNVDPVVDAGTDQAVDEGDTVSISGTFTDASAVDTHTATIDWDDGSPVDTVDPATTPVPGSHVYADNGVYTVELTVTDDDGGVGTGTLTVTVSNVDPVVEAGADQSVDEGDTVSISGTFTDAGSGDTHTATIDWDDGSPVDNIDPATSPVPGSHVYADDGVYTVELTVTDDDTGQGSDTLIVTVGNVAPTADAGADQSVDEGDTVSFAGSFTDPGSGDTHTIEWDFGDNITDSGSLTPTHEYADNGLYTVTLTVTDDDTGVGIDTLTVTVSNVAPTADAGADQSVNEGDTVSFAGSFTDPGSADTHTIEWDFGDTSTDSGSLTPTHVYADDGIYTVKLTVTDDDGGVGIDTLTVTVENAPPVVDAGADQSVDEGDTVSFSGSFTDPGSGDTHTIEWDFGDTSTDLGSLTPTHVYADNGVYTVELTVTDNNGGVGTDTLTVTVSNVAPVVDAGPGDLEVPVRQPVNITVEFSDQGSADTHTATVNWGDNTPVDNIVPAVSPMSASHIYAVAGEFNVVVTITDDDGDSVTHTMKITVIGIEVMAVTFNVLDPTMIVELDEPVEPDLTNFDLIGMEVSNSGKWDFQMSQQHGLTIMEQGPSKILHIDMKRDHVNAQQLTIAGLVKFLPVDFLARFGAFGDAAGSLSIEVTGAHDMRITMVANGFILGTLGDVSGNGEVTAFDGALIARAAVEGLSALPITSTTKEIDALLPGNTNTARATADVDKDGDVDSADALADLRLAVGLGNSAPPDFASDTKRCKLSVNNYDSGKLDVSIDVEDVSGVYCADIVMSYDPGTLTVADVSRTSSISGWVFADAAESGKLRISMAGLSQPAANGSLVNLSIDAASADAIKQLEIVEFKLNGGRSRAEVENLPKAFALMPNYPNPFNPETWIPYQLTVPAKVTVSIYNLNGQIVRRLELGTRMPGSYVNRSKAAYWDGRNESGEMVSSGIYFYQLQAGRDAAVRKMVIVK